MPDQDLPPELRQHHHIPPIAIPLELPLEDDVTPPVGDRERPKPADRGDSEPFLRRS